MDATKTPDSDGDSDATRAPGGGSPTPFGNYRLQQRLGEGGMGEVWVAEQLHPLRRQVAIKIIKAGMDTTQVIARFEVERQTLAIMDHPAIAKVFDAGTTPQGRPYFAMEYVRGESVTSYCDRQRLTTRERLELFVQLCDGVQHAHQKGIIHRDLKPSNVLVTILDDRPVPKIIDFGVAKATAQGFSDRPLFTEMGMLIGTPEYMSPEQAEMSTVDIDTRSDIYSLGVLLYELLTGSMPFDTTALRAGGFDQLRRTVREVDPLRPSTRLTRLGESATQAARNRRTDVPRLAKLLRGDLDWMTLKALEKDRTRRYQTANALALDVRRYLALEPVSAGPPGVSYRSRKFVRRHRLAVGAAATAVLLLIIFLALAVVQAQRVARERDRANREAQAAQQVSNFLIDLFQVSDPSEARGDTLTARQLLAAGARRIEQDLKDTPDIQSRLQRTIGAVYTNLGSYADAEPLLRRAVTTSRATLGPRHPETLTAMDAHADLLYYLEQFSDAGAIYGDVIVGRTEVLGADHRNTLKTKFDLATVYVQQQKWSEAERLITETLQEQRRALGPDDPDTLSSMNSLQGLFFRQKRFADALPLAQLVVDKRRALLGGNHPNTLVALHNLATVYHRLRDAAAAEETFLECLSGRRRVLGERHPDTANTQASLALLYREQGRYAEAEPLVLSSYETLRASLGEQNPRVVSAIRSGIALYRAKNDVARTAEWEAKLPPQ